MNKDRVYFLDLARGFAIFVMVLQHCIIMHEKTAGEGDTILGNILILLGTAPAAPVFMLIMGIFLMKSQASSTRIIIRGAKLLLLGYILNFLRFTVPMFIADSENPLYYEGESPLSFFFAVDIFQLAGLSLIAGAFVKKYSQNKYLFPLAVLIILLISPFLWGKFANVPFLSLLWGESENVYLPFFPWVVYPLLGMYLSKYLVSRDSLDRTLRIFLQIGLGLICTGLPLLSLFPVGDYYRSGLGVHLLITGFVFAWFRFCYMLTVKISSDNRIFKLLFFWSRHVTPIYFIQWVLFGWSILLFGVNNQTDITSVIIGLVVLIITHLLAKNRKIQNLFSWV
ncbi:MAG: DUF1624 domain-containing protein [Desulfobacterales bacterium]|nr:DUF1624 domain-containing protein [Desulfobacterales bacterium]